MLAYGLALLFRRPMPGEELGDGACGERPLGLQPTLQTACDHRADQWRHAPVTTVNPNASDTPA